MTKRGTKITYSVKTTEGRKSPTTKPPQWWLTLPLFTLVLATFYGQGFTPDFTDTYEKADEGR